MNSQIGESKVWNVLVVDDEPTICWGLEKILSREGFRVFSAGSAEKGLDIARSHRFDLVLLDVRLPGMSGVESLSLFQAATNQAPVIVMSAFGDLAIAVQVVKQGAVDYLHKPFGTDDVLNVCKKALRIVEQNKRTEHDSPAKKSSETVSRPHSQELIGHSAAMQAVFRQIALVADSDLSILITGETGTGKELVASAIHRYSHRSDKPFVPVAPVTFNPSLLESELFGHVKGAFTDAMDNRAGLFEVASGGTILLDEIGDLPLSLQVKLLRVLEQRQYSRVGEIRSRPCDIRFLSATHHDLQSAAKEGRFRQDLIYRLSGAEIRLPSLRERPDDIEPLAVHFLSRVGYPNPKASIPDNVIHHLRSWHWPGNIRELRNTIERAAVLARGRPLDISDFTFLELQNPAMQGADQAMEAVLNWARQWILTNRQSTNEQNDVDAATGEESIKAGNLYEEYLGFVEPPLLKAVLESVDGNRSAAAEVLGMHRTTLRERLRRYQLD
ncbi:sigma-54-dependent transcriptional regulator [Pirellulaceae bacterium SH449]